MQQLRVRLPKTSWSVAVTLIKSTKEYHSKQRLRSFGQYFQELLPVWMEQMDGKVDTKVVVRLGRLLYFGKRDTVKGVLSQEKFKELMPGQDFATQFSRHLHPQKNVVQPMLEGLKDAGRGTMIDLTKATGLHLEVFPFLTYSSY